MSVVQCNTLSIYKCIILIMFLRHCVDDCVYNMYRECCTNKILLYSPNK